MDFWKILGIEPTTDKNTIKKAFAVLVKENPPEKDAAKYQLIREAFNYAVKYAGGNKSPSVNQNNFSVSDDYEKEAVENNEIFNEKKNSLDFEQKKNILQLASEMNSAGVKPFFEDFFAKLPYFKCISSFKKTMSTKQKKIIWEIISLLELLIYLGAIILFIIKWVYY